MKRFVGLFIVVFALSSFLCQAQSEQVPVRVAFWNMENFFDPFVDSTKAYNAFTEDGMQHWTKTRFYRKRNNMYKAILAMSENRPLGLLGMCEVENEYVLSSLFEQTPLKKHNYRWVHYEGPDKRGIDPAIVYSLDHFQLVESAVIPYYNPEDTAYHSRDILYAKFVAVSPNGAGDRGSLSAMTPHGETSPEGVITSLGETHSEGVIAGLTRNLLQARDTIHVFVNHWPSRYSGELETVGSRSCSAAILRAKVDSIIDAAPEGYRPKVIMMGDLNDCPTDPSVYDVLRARHPSEMEEGCYINLFGKNDGLGFEGTLKHQTDWQIFDQIIVTPGVMDGEGLRYLEGSARIFHADFMLEDDETYHGKKLFRTYVGPRYFGGFSDHLPVYIDLVR
ncbi:MAG: hypothetical protein IKM95_00260 [Bacteroidales bacterium]|nr:hypothetical protein [Bacteroidales bacterium]